MSEFLVFAGTSEGRRLVEALCESGASVYASVATEYGKTLLPNQAKIFSERMDAQEITTLLQSLRFDCVIDATHPYADLATQNIKAACAVAEIRYLRLARPERDTEGCVFTENAAQAAEMLSATTGRVLLTTGSKELDIFSRVPDYQQRIFPRVLPTVESIQRCIALGYPVQNIIAMQGPFLREMNAATMRQIGAHILVTKESGDAGGFSDKLGAARDVGAVAVVIGRPRDEAGLPYHELLETLRMDYQLSACREEESKPKLWFPLYTDLSDRKVCIFGGGDVAARRAAAILPFCRSVTVIAPQLDPQLTQLEVLTVQRAYMQGDCAKYDFIIAATDHREVNQAIHNEARAAGIPVNVADSPEECDFYFPAVIRKEAVIIGVTACGTDHKLAKSVADSIREQIDELVPTKGETKHAKTPPAHRKP